MVAQRKHAAALRAHHKQANQSAVLDAIDEVAGAMKGKLYAGQPPPPFDCTGLRVMRSCVERLPEGSLDVNADHSKNFMLNEALPAAVEQALALGSPNGAVCDNLGKEFTEAGTFMQVNSTYLIRFGGIRPDETDLGEGLDRETLEQARQVSGQLEKGLRSVEEATKQPTKQMTNAPTKQPTKQPTSATGCARLNTAPSQHKAMLCTVRSDCDWTGQACVPKRCIIDKSPDGRFKNFIEHMDHSQYSSTRLYVRTHDCRCFNPAMDNSTWSTKQPPYFWRACQDKDNHPKRECSQETPLTCRNGTTQTPAEVIRENCKRTCSLCSMPVDKPQMSTNVDGSPHCIDTSGRFVKRFSEWTETIADGTQAYDIDYNHQNTKHKPYMKEYACLVQALRQKFVSEEQMATGRAITASSGCPKMGISGGQMQAAQASIPRGPASVLGESSRSTQAVEVGRRGLSPGFKSSVGGWLYVANRAGNDELGEATLSGRRGRSPLASSGRYVMSSDASNRAGNDEEFDQQMLDLD